MHNLILYFSFHKPIYFLILCIGLIACDDSKGPDDSTLLESIPGTVDQGILEILNDQTVNTQNDQLIDQQETDQSLLPMDSSQAHRGELSLQYTSSFLLDNWVQKSTNLINIWSRKSGFTKRILMIFAPFESDFHEIYYFAL